MVDLNEPVRRSYSETEKEEVSRNFLILLHSFLLLYLALHNLLIPLLINALKGRDLLQDVHYWFLFQIPVHLWLRERRQISFSYNFFLLIGSFARLIFYSFFMFTRSWTMVSVYLSEVSALIFCFIIWSQTRKDKFVYLAFLGLFVTPYLATIEKYPPEVKPEKVMRKGPVENYGELGCKGSELKINMTGVVHLPYSSVAVLKECGFAENLLRYNDSVDLFNDSSIDINLRLYELKRREGRFSWKFVRLLRVEKNQRISLKDNLKKDSMYLLKSPERRKTGITVLIPATTVLKGTFKLNMDTINWRRNE
ncbi:MAG: hypothetical protein ACLGHN_01615 [Bacteriovoracia bacterium]